MAHLRIVKSNHQAEALKERDLFLREHPELRELQSRIDSKLENAESDHNRLILLHEMMMASFLELNERLQDLKELREKR